MYHDFDFGDDSDDWTVMGPEQGVIVDRASFFVASSFWRHVDEASLIHVDEQGDDAHATVWKRGDGDER
ncbi:hypothetical protein ACFQE1_02065 [Halobium palmae]|uniref:Uncharacterized protein n=1 Tax=Halobium palmae TaxID=1776492 RepID=A0ABD5RVF2_9EURY